MRAADEQLGGELQGFLGPTIEGRVPYITTSSRADFLHAFDKRINFHTSLEASPKMQRTSRRLVKRLCPAQMPRFDWDPELFEEWITKFSTEKESRMRAAIDNQGLQRVKDYSDKDVFTKIESLVKPEHTVKGRVIFKGTDLYNAVSGPMFMELMRRFKDCETGNTLQYDYQVAYKETTDRIADFLTDGPQGSYLEADFTANDKYQCKTVQRLELVFMKRLGAPKWFLRLHAATNRCRVLNGKYGLMAWIENQLPTGATDTTFRNSFWNLCIFNHWWLGARPGKTRVAILGDDMLAATERWVRRCSAQYRKCAAEARMEAKVTMHHHLSQCHFLSKHFYPSETAGKAVMLPFLGKVLAKFNVRPNNNQAVSNDEYMAGKALSACYEFRHCHTLRSMFAERAFLHLHRTEGVFSMEGVSWNVRMAAENFAELATASLNDAHAARICVRDGVGHDVERRVERMLFPDLIKQEDLCSFWQARHPTLSVAELVSAFRRVVCHEDPVVLSREVLQMLVDY